MSKKNHWIITRPKRKLILVPDLLKIFRAVVEGENWEGNREIQIEFEKSLKTSQWKAQNISKDGSGGRTYAALLFMLGLWFENSEGVELTNAGKEIVENNPPVPILTKQLIDFQYPSPYSIKVRIDNSFQLKPYKFILRLFAEKSLDEITQDEIAFCAVARAKKDNDLDNIYQLIQTYRRAPERVIQESLSLSGASEDNLRNIGNTVVNQLEYTGLFQENNEIRGLRIKPDKKDLLDELLSNSKASLISNPEDFATFQMRYGSGLSKSKDYRYTSVKPTKIDPNERAVLVTYYEIASNKPIDIISEELIQEIAEYRGISYEKVERVLHTLADKPSLDRFEEKYIQLSKGGNETATDFEIKTEGIFSAEGFGFSSVWVGPKPRHPDLFVYFDKVNKRHGIIDAKAYKEYNLPLDHKNKMAHTYVPNFRKIIYEGEEYDLMFFAYVAGGYGSNMHNSFKELTTMCGDVAGSYITSLNLLKLLRLHKKTPFSPEKFGEVFACSKEIRYEDVLAN